MYHRMMQDILPDTVRVTTAFTTTLVAVEFVDGYGKVITWALGTIYMVIKLIQLVKKNESTGKK